MRILFIANFPSAGVPTRGVFNLRAALGLRSFGEVQVVRFQYWRPGRRAVSHGTYEGFPVMTVSLPYIPGGPRVRRLLIPIWLRIADRYMSEHVRDVDVMHSVGVGLYGMIGSHMALKWLKPHVAQAIGSDLLLGVPRHSSRHDGRGWLDGVDAVLCNSEALRKEWRCQFPSGPEAMVLYRGTDLNRFSTDRMVANPARRFLFLGGLRGTDSNEHGHDLKGGLTLMRVWRDLEQEPNFAAHLIFGGPGSDGREVERWRASLNRPENVRLVGLLPPSRVRDAIEEVDVVLVPSWSEGLPNLAVEASAMGRVVFGSDVGGVPEVVLHQETGLLLPAGDNDAWITAMRNAISGTYPLADWGVVARERAVARFDGSRYAADLYEVYRNAQRFNDLTVHQATS